MKRRGFGRDLLVYLLKKRLTKYLDTNNHPHSTAEFHVLIL